MRIVYGASLSKLVEAAASERRWLDEYTSVEIQSYRPGMWGRIEERYRMFNLLTSEFPSGFLPLLERAAAKGGLELLVDRGALAGASAPDPQADLSWLRPYQMAAVRACLRARRGLVKVPTGGGKTEVFIALTRAVPCEWLFVVHRTDLVGQAARRYMQRTGERAGYWDSARGWVRGTCNVTVATFQSLWLAMRKKDKRAREMLDSFGGLNVDETHAQPADSFFKVSMACRNAHWRIGQSGTPLDRSPRDSLRTVGSLGPICFKLSPDVLIDAGVLSRPVIRMVVCKQSSSSAASWREVYRDLVVRSPTRNAVVASMVERAARPCLVFVEELEHGEELREELRRRGVRAEFAHGGDWVAKREEKLRGLVDGSSFDVLICTVIFQEGIDVPELASVVNAAGKASVVASLQRIGRGMRTSAGKDTFEVWDVRDAGQRWLAQHASDREAAYAREGYVVEIEGKQPTAPTLTGRDVADLVGKIRGEAAGKSSPA